MVRLEDQKAVSEEIRLIVKEAKRDGQPVKADGLAKIVAWTYPHSGLSAAQIADRISEAAVAAGVSVYHGNAARRSVMTVAYSMPA
jgi:hypothetical protein